MNTDPFPQQLPTLQRLGVDEPNVTSAADIATTWFNAFSNAVKASDVTGILDLFLEDGFWKDFLALTWDFRTLEGRGAIKNLLDHRLVPTGLVDMRLNHEPLRAPVIEKLFPDLVLLRFTFEFGTKVGKGTAVCYLAPTPGPMWKAYILNTCLQSLNDFPEKIGPLRQQVAEHGTWEERRHREVDLADGDPTVLIIGAGHVGLSVAARLKYLGVSHLIIDQKPRVGGGWWDRYKALCLHDTVWSNQTAYLPFPRTWPVFAPARKLADWLEGYASYLELNAWTSTIVVKTEWDDDRKIWTVELNKGGKEVRVLKVKHLVFGTGSVGRPKTPDIPNKETFKGEVVHSSEFTSASNYVGKKTVIVGACTSAHDIAMDFVNNRGDVTIYQRSPTFVFSVGAIQKLVAPYYNEDIPTDIADIYTNCMPFAVVRRLHQRIVPQLAQTIDKELLDGLAKAGFKTSLGPYNAGLVPLVFSSGGGFYFDVGASKHIIDGDIKIKSGTKIERYTEKGLKFEDGTELDADLVIFATGYGDVRDSMRDICSPQVASKVKQVWGVTEEGDFSGVWRDCGHEHMWFGAGSLAVSRTYSLYLALQITAIEAGILKKSEVMF